MHETSRKRNLIFCQWKFLTKVLNNSVCCEELILHGISYLTEYIIELTAPWVEDPVFGRVVHIIVTEGKIIFCILKLIACDFLDRVCAYTFLTSGEKCTIGIEMLVSPCPVREGRYIIRKYTAHLNHIC